MIPLNNIIRKCTTGYKLSRSQENFNHQMYMDNTKQLAKNEKELENIMNAVRIYSQDIGMEFGTEKCAMLVMKSGKRHLSDGMERPNQDKIRIHAENETYKYLGILEADIIKQVKIKTRFQKNIPGELENYSYHYSLAETVSKERIPGLYPSLDILTLSQVDQRRTNGPRNKKTYDHA